MTLIDAKSGVNGFPPIYDTRIPEAVRLQMQAEALNPFRRASEALEQNPGFKLIVEFQTKSAFDSAMRFFSEVVAKEGYADNIMLRLRGKDYLTEEVAVRGREPVVTFDRAGKDTRVEDPVFTPASQGPRPHLDVGNEFTTTAAVNRAYELELTNACFAADTKVHTIDGFCPIEFLSVGTLVLSRCEKTGEQGYRRITKTFEHEDRPTLSVKFELGVTGQLEETYRFRSLETTAEHPFWVAGLGWVPASELQPGQQLEIVDTDPRPDIDRPEGQKLKDYQTDGKRRTATVVSVKPGRTRTTVYNIEVEDFHTYFVGFAGVWVHNKRTRRYHAFWRNLPVHWKIVMPEARRLQTMPRTMPPTEVKTALRALCLSMALRPCSYRTANLAAPLARRAIASQIF